MQKEGLHLFSRWSVADWGVALCGPWSCELCDRGTVNKRCAALEGIDNTEREGERKAGTFPLQSSLKLRWTKVISVLWTEAYAQFWVVWHKTARGAPRCQNSVSKLKNWKVSNVAEYQIFDDRNTFRYFNYETLFAPECNLLFAQFTIPEPRFGANFIEPMCHFSNLKGLSVVPRMGSTVSLDARRRPW